MTCLSAFIEEEKHRLFPYTPIEVTCDEDTTLSGQPRRYHVFVEGEWDSWEADLEALSIRLSELLKQLSNPTYQRNKDWPGWAIIARTMSGEQV